MLKYPSKSPCDISIACHGLSFKPNIDDLRESPAPLIAKKIIEILLGAVLLVEPNITSLSETLKKFQLSDLDKSIEEADLHLLLVDHSEFYSRRPSSGIVIDTRGIWSA